MSFLDRLRHPATQKTRAEAPREQQVVEYKMRLYNDYLNPTVATDPDIYAAIRLGTLVHGPGATDLIYKSWHYDDSNSAVFACLSAIATGFPEAPAKVWRELEPGKRDELPDHPLKQLLDRPNNFLSREQMWSYVQWCKHITGNAYWRKIRSGRNVVELWPISPARIQPVTIREDAQAGIFISYYEYVFDPSEDPERIPPEDIIHFRLGIDDKDNRIGASPLARLVREVAGDEEAHKWQTSMLLNGGTAGMLVQVPVDSSISEEQAERLKARFEERFTGDNRGRVGVLMGGASAQPYGFSPEQMDMKSLHRIPEERISAVLRVPAIIAGLGAGLDRSTYSNYREAREMFAEMTLLPLYQFDAATLNMQLTPEFASDKKIVVAFDQTDLRAFQEDEDAKWARLDKAVQTGWVRANEARTDVGLPPDMDEEVVHPPAPAFPAPGDQQDQQPADQQASKQWPGKIPSDRTLRKLPKIYAAMIAAAEDDLTDELNVYLDGQRKRVKSKLVS